MYFHACRLMDALSRLKSEYYFCSVNLQMLVASESHFLLRILNGSFQVLDSIKYQIDILFADFFCSNPSSKVISTRYVSVLLTDIKDQNVSQMYLRCILYFISV